MAMKMVTMVMMKVVVVLVVPDHLGGRSMFHLLVRWKDWV